MNERAETLRMRLLQIKGLQKKYGSIDNIINERKNLLNNLKLLENFEQEINEINKLIHTTQIDLGDAALKLSEQRKTTASNLEAIVQDTLKTLGIENAIFLINFDSEAFEDSKYSSNELIARIKNNIYNVFPNGIDKVEFYISPNIGEKPKPLSQIASGGEISRVMLSIKNALSNAEEIQLLVFDEIDSGISGRIAQKAGSVMKNLSKKHQIIAITHLPQIASYADRNISIRKFEKNNHTHIIAEIVEGNNRIYEIAKLFSGENINDIALKNAKKLINEAK